MAMEIVKISTESITLGQFLKYAGIAGTGGEGKEMIQQGLILVNGETVRARSRSLKAGDEIQAEGGKLYVISRE